MSAVLLDTCAILWLAAGLAPRDGVMDLVSVDDAIAAFERYVADSPD